MNADQARTSPSTTTKPRDRGISRPTRPGMLAQYGQRWRDLRDGTAIPRTIEEASLRTGDMLARTRYLAWEDAIPPRIEVSADGTMAWLPGEIHARAIRTQSDGSDRETAYPCVWLQVCARQDGRWVTIVSTPSVRIEPQPS